MNTNLTYSDQCINNLFIIKYIYTWKKYFLKKNCLQENLAYSHQEYHNNHKSVLKF